MHAIINIPHALHKILLIANCNYHVPLYWFPCSCHSSVINDMDAKINYIRASTQLSMHQRVNFLSILFNHNHKDVHVASRSLPVLQASPLIMWAFLIFQQFQTSETYQDFQVADFIFPVWIPMCCKKCWDGFTGRAKHIPIQYPLVTHVA